MQKQEQRVDIESEFVVVKCEIFFEAVDVIKLFANRIHHNCRGQNYQKEHHPVRQLKPKLVRLVQLVDEIPPQCLVLELALFWLLICVVIAQANIQKEQTKSTQELLGLQAHYGFFAATYSGVQVPHRKNPTLRLQNIVNEVRALISVEIIHTERRTRIAIRVWNLYRMLVDEVFSHILHTETDRKRGQDYRELRS